MNLNQLSKLRHKLLVDLLEALPNHPKIKLAIKESLEAYKDYRHTESVYQKVLRAKHPHIPVSIKLRAKAYRRQCPKNVKFDLYRGLTLIATYQTIAYSVNEARIKLGIKTILFTHRQQYPLEKFHTKSESTSTMSHKEFFNS